MTTKRKTEERLFSLRQAHVIALELYGVLTPACIRLEIAGSIRRGKPEVHDIDLVVQARYHDNVTVDLFNNPQVIHNPPVELFQAITRLKEDFQCSSIDPKILRFVYRDIPVEIYLSERDGSNYGALLQMRTGSARWNTYMASRAIRVGKYYRAGYGIYEHDDRVRVGDFGERLDDGTEAGIFKALDMLYQPPAGRI
jgi:DNA polymerase/3'-5' exonuclease PolX